MERLISVDQKIINRIKPDQYSLPKLLKWSGGFREYYINGTWTNQKPNQKPEGNRLVFSSREQYRVARDAYFAWTNIVSQQITPPELPDAILERLFQARLTAKPITLFIPWGVRPVGIFGQPEIETLGMLEKFNNNLKSRNITATVFIMTADLYATEVNRQVDTPTTNAYFEAVGNQALQKGFTVKPWSAIRKENQNEYNRLKSELNPNTILPSGVLERALKASGRRSGYEDGKGIESAALAYLQERVCEAEIIEKIYKPIKVSMVAKGKDAYVDRNLPRLYILPERLQFPWLK
jgi:hypothetical protein